MSPDFVSVPQNSTHSRFTSLAESSLPLPSPTSPSMHKPTKTVVVLGASYAGKSNTCHVCRVPPPHTTLPSKGHRAVHQLVEKLPEDWRVVVIERNTYVLWSFHLSLAVN